MCCVTFALLLATVFAPSQTIFYQESMDASGEKNTGFYEEIGTGWREISSSVKSSAEGLTGLYTRFSWNAVIGDATYRFYPHYSASFDSTKEWDVYVTVPGPYASVDAEGAVWTASTDGSNRDRSGVVPLVGNGPPDGMGRAGNKWLRIVQRVPFIDEGGYIEFAESPPQEDRFYADAVRFVESTESHEPTYTPTSTPTVTPTPTATPTYRAPEEEMRALWVTRWDYTSAEDVRTIVANAAEHHFNTLLFQVRGNGTAFYDSPHEPWAWELTGTNVSTLGTDPGWDPLALACQEAHGKGMEIHAYVNMYPGWRGPSLPPSESDQLWNTHQEWFTCDSEGNTMPVGSGYSFLDPGVPDVQQYIRDICADIATRYDVDGIHYDYIRYPSDAWGYNPISVGRFFAQYGDVPENLPSEWGQWKRSQVTDLVTSLGEDLKTLKPGLKISAAVFSNWDSAYGIVSQDYRTWLSKETLDVAIPMMYNEYLELFRELLSDHLAHSFDRWLIPGIGGGSIPLSLSLEKTRISRDLDAHGVAFFAYSLLFPNHVPSPEATDFLAGPFREPASIPAMPWKNSSGTSRWETY